MKLIDINRDNWEEVIMLTTDKEGKHILGEEFVASNAYSIIQATYEKGWTIKVIENDKKLIGFTMYGFSEEDNCYELCRFMIDRKFQGKGYGKKALALIVDEMKKNCPHDEIYLSVDPENFKAKHIYEQLGFISTGKIIDEEEVYEMKFNTSK